MTIDISRLPPPLVLESINYEIILGEFRTRFLSVWNAARAGDPSLPTYDVGALETDPVAIVAQAWSYLRMLDRVRVNDAVRALLAALATGSDLDALAANQGVQRLVVTPANGDIAAVMETDARLLTRYLASFDRASAGSADLYRYLALTAWPACHDVAVYGFAVHGRRGDVDVVLTGPGGRAPTSDEMLAVRAAINAPGVRPESVAVTIIGATRAVYDVELSIRIPGGPDPSLVVEEVAARVRALTAARLRIGAEIPVGAITGAAYGPSVEYVALAQPAADLPAIPYVVRALGALNITWDVRQ